MKQSSRTLMVCLLNLQQIQDEMIGTLQNLTNKAAIRLLTNAIECSRKLEHYTIEAIRAEEEFPSLVIDPQSEQAKPQFTRIDP